MCTIHHIPKLLSIPGYTYLAIKVKCQRFMISNLPLFKVVCLIIQLLGITTLIRKSITDAIFKCKLKRERTSNVYIVFRVGFMVFNATANTISGISWRAILQVEETRVSGENHCIFLLIVTTIIYIFIFSECTHIFFLSCTNHNLCDRIKSIC